MIVECPRCNARYRVDDSVLEEDPRFRCSRCSHVFTHGEDSADPEEDVFEHASDEGEEETSEDATESAFEDDEMAASEDESETAEAEDEEPPREEPPVPSKRPSRRIAPGESLAFTFEPGPSATQADDEEEDDEEGPSALEDDDELTFRDDEEDEKPTRDPRQPRFVEGEDELRVEPEAPESSLRPWVVFVTLLVFVWGNLAWYLRANPAEAVELLGGLPVVGRSLTEDRVLRTRVHLEDLRGGYQQIKDGQRVFIVAGRAMNASRETLKGVQIESALYDAAGDPIETKSIYCGNAMSTKMVRDLSPKEISLLQRLEPPQRFEILPGESAEFTIVFMTPPADLSEFSAQVVAAERTFS